MFEREQRYLVIKYKDAADALTVAERHQLASLTEKVAKHRLDADRGLLDCVVVEADWPIYNDTWMAIEQMAATDASKD